MAKKKDGGKKAAQPAPKMLKEVKITAKRPKHTEEKVLVKGGTVAKRRVDSLNRAGWGKAVGAGSKDRYGNTTYGADASDAIKKGLQGSKKK